ncbi:MAG TPA: endolytic transglycosylase MltG [Ilumatobacter sp.]|nr:endolytic transglycosylase MltG [Ilumatobacter sp.]
MSDLDRHDDQLDQLDGLDEIDTSRPSDWWTDEWDDVAAVPVVERLPPQRRILKWVVWTSFVLVVALVLVAGWVGWWYLQRVRPDANAAGSSVAVVDFTIEPSDSVETIAARLETAGLIEDRSVFLWYIDRQGGLEVVPGFYELRTNDHMGNVLARLQTPPDQTYARVTFPEGFTVEQMAARLAEVQPRLQSEAFIAASNSVDVPSAIRPAGVSSLEGLLFPDTYQVSNADNAAQVVERMVALMERVAIEQEGIVDGAAALSLTPYEVLIVASLIEREARLDEDRPKIARVIYNRLFLGMNLEIDASLYYENSRDTPFPQLRQQDSPYNLYMYPGLPPTPIANPGRAAIRAALNPSPNPPAGDPLCVDLPDPTRCYFLFYVLSSEDGGHTFAATYEQHLVNVEASRAAGLL